MGTFAEIANVDYYLLFADQGTQTSVFCFRFQQTNRSLPFPFSVCSSCKRKFIVCPFVDKDRKGSYLFTNELNGLNGLVHLWILESLKSN
jgi:hypothetical protein